jgi:hypothetical protein
MSNRLPGLLFVVTFMTGLAMGGLVVAAPYILGDGAESPDLLLLFARDMTVRRTAFFCSVGLVATAFIFFRAASPKAKEKASVNMTGA